jgi:hypothetical protein
MLQTGTLAQQQQQRNERAADRQALRDAQQSSRDDCCGAASPVLLVNSNSKAAYASLSVSSIANAQLQQESPSVSPLLAADNRTVGSRTAASKTLQCETTDRSLVEDAAAIIRFPLRNGCCGCPSLAMALAAADSSGDGK